MQLACRSAGLRPIASMGSAISSGTYAKPVKAMYSASIPIIGLHHGASRNGLSAPPRRSQRRSDDRRGALGARTNEHCSPAVALLNVSALLWKFVIVAVNEKCRSTSPGLPILAFGKARARKLLFQRCWNASPASPFQIAEITNPLPPLNQAPPYGQILRKGLADVGASLSPPLLISIMSLAS